ncbi:phage holin family protein [Alcaligenes sp. SDU_A2]|uniref:phage holin family protein n=1 Tax=Alcaligenes sp. SDU_A2 TaxID=3136634 RepID=UPI002BB83C19|nr:phage holin family protein [Alcaligenes sp.]
MLASIFTVFAVLANVATAGRLICYRRGCARYRPGMSVLAYVLIVSSGGQVIDALFNHSPVSGWEAAFTMVIAVLVWRAKGNVACMVSAVHD